MWEGGRARQHPIGRGVWEGHRMRRGQEWGGERAGTTHLLTVGAELTLATPFRSRLPDHLPPCP